MYYICILLYSVDFKDKDMDENEMILIRKCNYCWEKKKLLHVYNKIEEKKILHFTPLFLSTVRFD